jgi:YD repeat-containing protein
MVALAFPTWVLGAEDVTNYAEPGLTPGREYVHEQFAEHIDPFTGNLSLQHVDLFIPGSGGFDLRVRRTYNSNAANTNIYSPFGRGWDIHFGRVVHTSGHLNEVCSNAATGTMILELPDGSRETLHKSNGAGNTVANSDYLTTSFWKAQCDSGGGVIVYSPDGTRYDMTVADAPYWHASRITDRFGNTFSLSYLLNTTTGHDVVSQVSASDGRVVNFSYGAGRLIGISGGGVTWSYSVQTAGDGSYQLTQVTPPAGGVWSYSYNGNFGTSPGSYLLQSVINPYTGVTSYAYQFVNFLPGIVGYSPSTAVQTKTAGGDTWTYSFTPSCVGGGYDSTNVTYPGGLGTDVYHHYGYCTVGQGQVWMIGLLHDRTSGADQTETLSWTSQTISADTVTRPGYQLTDTQVNRPLLQQRQLLRDGISYQTTYANFDSWGNSQTISEFGTASRSRSVSYYNNPSAWIIGVAQTETYPSNSITRSIGTRGEIQSETKFNVTTSYTYFADGAVSSITNAKPATSSYGSYLHGVPQSETRFDGVAITRSVDGLGNITSQSDGDYNWSYGYDGIGRLTSIDFPVGSDATIGWSNTSRSLSRGALNETSTFDGFGRTITFNKNGTVTTYRYDALGRKTFQSFPGSGSGLTYYYDRLDRVKEIDSPVGSKRFNYSGGSVSVTNERNFITTYAYARYGNPDEGFVTAITPPDSSAKVTISRNELGIVNSVAQNGVTRTYGRDNRFFLTSITQPEDGTTTFGPDGVGNPLSKTNAGRVLNYSYDGMNRLTGITGSGINVTLGYNNRGKLHTVQNGSASRTYDYDANGNLTGDTLAIDGRTFAVGYGYDGIDGLSSITYPMNKGTVSYFPDSNGRPQAVSPYLDSVHYYGSGNLQSITYHNGIAQSYGENNMQLPSSITASTIQLGKSYGYDGANNVSSITDSYVAAESRTLNYDGMDRLTSASGPWGGGTIGYDAGGNITLQQLGSYTINYTYSSNRVSSITGSVSRTYGYDNFGNVTSNGQTSFLYNNLSQMTCANCGASNEVDYQYDGQGFRVSQTVNGIKTYFVQSPSGDLQFEYSPYGLKWTKNVFLNGKRVASETGSDATAVTMSAAAAPSSVQYTQSSTLSVTISPAGATGTVEFIDGNTSLGIAPISGGTASLVANSVSVGTHTIVANYSGDATYQPATASTTLTVSQLTSSTTLNAPTDAILGSTVSLTASVTGYEANTNVSFYDGSASIGTAPVSNGTASMQYQVLTAGSHPLSAQYLGDQNISPSTSSTVTMTVPKASTATQLSELNPNQTYGAPVSFRVSVIGAPGVWVTGTVTLYEGAAVLATAVLTGGSATISVSNMSVGSHSLTASYAGDANYLGSASGPIIQNITAGPRSTLRSLPPEIIEN